MFKKSYDNYRVVVEYDPYPYSLGKGDVEKDHQDSLKDLLEFSHDIKRRCDNVGNIELEFDTHETCEFCGKEKEWDDESQTYCCDKAAVEHVWTKPE